MKSTLVFVLLIVASAIASDELFKFKTFMKKFNKVYETTAEFEHRFDIFKQSLKKIDRLNARNSTATYGVTKFSDLSIEEFKGQFLNTAPFVKQSNWPVAPLYTEAEIAALPTAWDWSEKGAVTPVKNQGDCGSCWAFSATGNMEGQWFLAGNSLVGLSEQNLVDCDQHCLNYSGESVCDDGCNGGLMPNAFLYTIGNGGIDTETSYPYVAEGPLQCQYKSSDIGATIDAWTMIVSNETQMKAYMQNNGPLSIAVSAEPWQFYIFGVFSDPECGDTLDHGVLITGYGTETDWFGQEISYWTIKNSWGEDWGEFGYIYVEMGSNQCGLDLFPCSSIINKK